MAPTLTQKEATAAWMQDIAPFAILTTDVELKITGWNQWLVTHSALRSEDVMGRPLAEIFPEITTRKLQEYFHRALRGEVSVLSSALHGYLLPLPGTVREKGDAKMQQTARIAPLHSGEQVLGTITIIEDVSQREFQAEILRRQHAREKLLSWSLAHLLQTTDPLQEVQSLLLKVREDLGLDGALDLQSSVLENTGASKTSSAPDSGAGHRSVIDATLNAKCAAEKRLVSINRVQQNTDLASSGIRAAGIQAYLVFPLLMGPQLLGTLCFSSYTREVVPTSDVEFLSTLSQYVAIAIDRAVRERTLRDAEQKLRNHADVLEITVAERTRRLHDTISQMESFSYSVAHDLRAPIRALKGYCDVLSEDFRRDIPEEAATIIQRLSRSATRLDELTRDLLKFSHLSLQEIDIEQVDLTKVVEEIIYLNPLLQNGLVKIKGPLGIVMGQRTLVHQCISNLLDNAVKFTLPGRPAEIAISSELSEGTLQGKPSTKAPFNPATHAESPRSSDEAKLFARSNRQSSLRRRLWVADNGIGVPPDAHEKIFGIFERLSESSAEGTGIGLAIVARAMQQMGGACGLESAVGQGSRFWLEFHPSEEAPLDGK